MSMIEYDLACLWAQQKKKETDVWVAGGGSEFTRYGNEGSDAAIRSESEKSQE